MRCGKITRRQWRSSVPDPGQSFSLAILSARRSFRRNLTLNQGAIGISTEMPNIFMSSGVIFLVMMDCNILMGLSKRSLAVLIIEIVLQFHGGERHLPPLRRQEKFEINRLTNKQRGKDIMETEKTELKIKAMKKGSKFFQREQFETLKLDTRITK